MSGFWKISKQFVNRMLLPENIFKDIVNFTPLISIDLIVKRPDNAILVGKRNNRPAKGMWFVPGGRVFKNETLEIAYSRIVRDELGIDVEKKTNSRFNGVYEHFYDDSYLDTNISTHYIVLAYEINLMDELGFLPAYQHSEYEWLQVKDLVKSKDVHFYTKNYFNESAKADSFSL